MRIGAREKEIVKNKEGITALESEAGGFLLGLGAGIFGTGQPRLDAGLCQE